MHQVKLPRLTKQKILKLSVRKRKRQQAQSIGTRHQQHAQAHTTGTGSMHRQQTQATGTCNRHMQHAQATSTGNWHRQQGTDDTGNRNKLSVRKRKAIGRDNMRRKQKTQIQVYWLRKFPLYSLIKGRLFSRKIEGAERAR